MQSSTCAFGNQRDVKVKVVQFIDTSSAISHLFVHQSKRELAKQGRMKGFTQWINLNQNNRFVLAHQFLYCKRNLALSSNRKWVLRQVGRQMTYESIWAFILFNITAMLLQYQNCISVGFCRVKLILRCILKCERFGSHFSSKSLLLSTSIPNDVCDFVNKVVALV